MQEITAKTGGADEKNSPENNTRGTRRVRSTLFMLSDYSAIRTDDRHYSWREVYYILGADLPDDEIPERRHPR